MPESEKKQKHKKYTDEQVRLLKSVVDHFNDEDRGIRERQIRTWRRLKLFWENFTQVWYSEVAHDWRIWDEQQTDQSNNDQAYYDKPVNVYRAYLESIIAALSVTVPPIKCYPDDANNNLDLLTAKAGDKISQLIFRHNDAPLLWLQALFINVTEGMVGCYSYPKADESYGTYERKEYEEHEQEYNVTMCSLCGYVLNQEPILAGEQQQPGSENLSGLPVDQDMLNRERDEYMPDDEDAPLHAMLNEGQDLCPACMQMMDPELAKQTFTTTRLVGITTEPKTRICLEVYGGLYLKVPNYAKKQADIPYLIQSYETNTVNAIEMYPDLHECLANNTGNNTGGTGYDTYEQWGRLSPQYRGEYPNNTVTVRNAWLRPCAFNYLTKEEAKEMKELFPDGAKVVFIDDNFADAENESLDDCWTLTFNPLSDFIHFDPLGILLVSIQEITNDLISLTLQTIEHGIPQTFVDSAVVNTKAYEDTEVVPGGIYPGTPRSGQRMSDAFHEVKTAALSAEVLPFGQSIQTMGQLVSGALPSLFGGQLEGSETASEYSMSRSQALQRLQTTWKMLTHWWKQIFGKVIPMYIKELQDDERDVQRAKDGSFINVFIRRAELEGKIGKVELEANENLPITWSQQRDIVMQLLNAGNPQVLEIIGNPENLPLLRDILGLTDIYVPGEDDREKQRDEIKLLLNSEPMMEEPDPMMMMQAFANGMPPPQPQQIPSIEIDPIYDKHDIHFEVVRKWVTSEEGRQAKIDNPAGHTNVMLHGKMHYMMIQQQMMEEAMNTAAAGPGASSESSPTDQKGQDKKSAPITGESDVQTVH